jgi:dihydroflavonol-4-reductase
MRFLSSLYSTLHLFVLYYPTVSFINSHQACFSRRTAMSTESAPKNEADESITCSSREQVVLVTGGTGYIAKHVILQLLNAGHSVKASTRSISRQQELYDALSPHLRDKDASLARLQVVQLDLTSDNGWAESMQDVDVLMHIASPCPSREPKHEEEVIRPAIDGAMRAVRAAHQAGVTRVIFTSSVAAVVNAELPKGRTMFDETDWSLVDKPGLSAYVKSKTLAEQAIWDYQEKEAPELNITTILPSFVMGAPLDEHYGSSIRKVERLLRSQQSRIPNYGYSCVDVRDIALMHLRALERPDASANKRFIGSSKRFMWVPEMAQILNEAYPELHICTRPASNWSIRFKALSDPSFRYVVVNLDRRRELSNTQSRELLGINFRDAKESLLETADYLVKNDKTARGK